MHQPFFANRQSCLNIVSQSFPFAEFQRSRALEYVYAIDRFRSQVFEQSKYDSD